MNIAISPPRPDIVAAPQPLDPPQVWARAEALVYRPGPDFDLVIPNLALRAGRRTALIGGNGSGKTTLLRMLLGTLAPDDGRLSLVGPAEGLLAATGRRALGVQQQDSGFQPGYRVSDILALNRAARGTVDDGILDAFGLAEIAGRRFGALSSGQKQRLQLAMALAHGPRFVILDEPTSNLDPVYEAVFARVLGALSQSVPGFTALFITHAANVVAQCDDVLMLARGRVEAHDALDRVIETRFGRCAALFEAAPGTLDTIATRLPPAARLIRRQGRLLAYGDTGLTTTATRLALEHDLRRFSTWHTGAADILESLNDD